MFAAIRQHGLCRWALFSSCFGQQSRALKKRSIVCALYGEPLCLLTMTIFESRFQLKLARGTGYGSTEAGGVALPLFDKSGAGKVLDRYKVAIVDANDNELPIGESGELVIRPLEPAIMASKYIGMPEETAKAWRNSWFHTGDFAKLDDEGNLYWLARMSERIRVKGEMVSAYEIEESIFTHPSVTDCAVIGIPDGTGEEQVKAFITLKEKQDTDSRRVTLILRSYY